MIPLAYKLFFWVPAVTTAVAGRIAWGNGLLRRPLVVLVWFVVALTMQLTGTIFSPVWAVGLGAQTILAVYLLIRLKTSW